MYTQNQINQFNTEIVDCVQRFNDTFSRLSAVNDHLTNTDAKEYLMYGAARRMALIFQCLRQIFLVYPPDRTNPLSLDELTNISVSLHAFFINLFGIGDNLAWTIVKERNINIARKNIGLYKSATQTVLTPFFKDYLNTRQIKTWHTEHLVEYRDALAHRIPLYILPCSVDEQGNVTNPTPIYGGSIANRGAKLHEQVIADFNTAVEIIENFAQYEFPLSITSVAFHSQTPAASLQRN